MHQQSLPQTRLDRLPLREPRKQHPHRPGHPRFYTVTRTIIHRLRANRASASSAAVRRAPAPIRHTRPRSESATEGHVRPAETSALPLYTRSYSRPGALRCVSHGAVGVAGHVLFPRASVRTGAWRNYMDFIQDRSCVFGFQLVSEREGFGMEEDGRGGLFVLEL